ncbi:ribbon-helix-helix protein, CopG family [Epibacterium ulvae]|uniref:ribbon-helix-helix protein, CopG family n=1 Tax=Epibacterium ulvae TaxID=1156985 RepID=UPI001BFC23AF|nr:ribbon-helix-helix protein, CopG family [Epibacterium ulvae]MBT8154359.1 ribbon-helix-helix protein, CopG family [Epibacterium ulvae]
MAKDKPTKSADGDKKNTSLRLDRKTLKALKIRAIEEDTSVQKIIERLVEDYLSDSKKKN